MTGKPEVILQPPLGQRQLVLLAQSLFANVGHSRASSATCWKSGQG
jgi:hypothetical protein